MRALIIFSLFALVVAVAAAAAKFHFLEEWKQWKSENGKHYLTEKEELERHFIWLSNKAYIEAHNAYAKIFGFTLKINHLADLAESEHHSQLGTYRMNVHKKPVPLQTIFIPPVNFYYPESVDWRRRGAVTSIKNQASCGSSYAFSATGALEGAYALAYGSLSSLSEQNLVDCSIPDGNHGCQGGNMYNAFLYIIENAGIDTESSYPYEAKQSQCNFNNHTVGAVMSGIVSITSGSELELKQAVAYAGPVAVAVDSRAKSFRFYGGGIYDVSYCSSSKINHAMLVIGYGTYKSKDYWILKNSWGNSWGKKGYIMMSRNRYNQCGIATDASYPTL